MSLTADSFQEKQNEVNHYQKQGYIYLLNFLKQHKIHFDKNVELGVTRNNDKFSMAFDAMPLRIEGKR